MNINTLGLSQIIFIAVVVLFSACTAGGNEATPSAKPVVEITSPTSSSNVAVGQEILITFNAADVSGLTQVELVIDGQPVLVDKIEPPVNSFVSSQRWTAATPGNHVIELRAFNVNGMSSEPVQTFLLVAGAVARDTPTPIPIIDTPTPTIVASPSPTSVALPPSPPLPATETPPPANEAVVTAVVRLNVRMGPSTDYRVLGVLDIGQTASITGRDEFSSWWQIEFQSANRDRGWVAADRDFSTAVKTESVPVVPAPPLENVVTATPTRAPPTSTPVVLKPTIFSFTADRYNVLVGETVVLSWDLANARAAFLRYNNVEEGVAAPGGKEIELDETTRFTLIAQNEAGETTATLTISVGESAPTPVPVLRDGKIRIANGQYIDFDQGLVQATTDSGTDFLWDGQAQQFFPQGGAAGTLLSRPYGDIDFEDCEAASYDKPIADVDGSAQVSGCYKTNEGRYGKFSILDWDFAANLTVQWQTWNNP